MFLILGRLGRIPIIPHTGLFFWFGNPNTTLGRFIENNGRIVSAELINFSRAPNIIFRKLDTEPICN